MYKNIFIKFKNKVILIGRVMSKKYELRDSYSRIYWIMEKTYKDRKWSLFAGNRKKWKKGTPWDNF